MRLGEWDVTTEGQQDCFDRSCLPPVQDLVVSLADFTIHQDYAHDRLAKTVVNDIGEFQAGLLSQARNKAGPKAP